MQTDNPPQPLNYITLGYIVGDVLSLPKENNRWVGTAYTAARVVFKSITAALLRGEEVKINGFGIFRIRERPARKISVSSYYGGSATPIGRYITQLPAKKYVIFEPSKVLLKMLNEPTPCM